MSGIGPVITATLPALSTPATATGLPATGCPRGGIEIVDDVALEMNMFIDSKGTAANHLAIDWFQTIQQR